MRVPTKSFKIVHKFIVDTRACVGTIEFHVLKKKTFRNLKNNNLVVNHLKFLWSCHPLRISITSDMGFQCCPNKTEKPDHILNRKTFLRCIYLHREIDKRVLDSRFSRKRDAIRFGTSILALSRVRTLVRAGLWASYPHELWKFTWWVQQETFYLLWNFFFGLCCHLIFTASF